MIEFQYRPLTTWPGTFTKSRRRAPFRAGYAATLRQLEHELTHLRASKVVIEAALADEDIRLDGMLRASARPTHPGIILSFQTPTGPLRFPCDSYDEWQQNLRAIVLALDALRRVDRYGVTRHAEQYRGWKQLPSGIQPAMTVEQAAAVMCRLAGNPCGPRDLIGIPANVVIAYRAAARRTHPDHNGSNGEDFKLLGEAKRVLDQHHGET